MILSGNTKLDIYMYIILYIYNNIYWMNENIGVYISIKFKIIPFCAIKFPIRDSTQYSREMQSFLFK